jgi:hypothetical protein
VIVILFSLNEISFPRKKGSSHLKSSLSPVCWWALPRGLHSTYQSSFGITLDMHMARRRKGFQASVEASPWISSPPLGVAAWAWLVDAGIRLQGILPHSAPFSAFESHSPFAVKARKAALG